MPPDGQSLTAMTANLRFGEADPHRVVELVREHDVDLLSLQELTPEAIRGLRNAGLDDLLDQSVLSPAPGASGTGLFANAPMDSAGLVNEGVGFRMQSAEMTFGGTMIRVTSVHPVPPTSSVTVERWRSSLHALPAAADGADFGLLAGDFNATLDHEELREVLDRGYFDAADATGDGLASTWSRSLSPPLTIDHVLVDERVHAESTATYDLPGSDHQSVIAELVVPITD
jgi:endonuclease/exonuclease/phosphatase family metal-dependent hydrolase